MHVRNVDSRFGRQSFLKRLRQNFLHPDSRLVAIKVAPATRLRAAVKREEYDERHDPADISRRQLGICGSNGCLGGRLRSCVTTRRKCPDT